MKKAQMRTYTATRRPLYPRGFQASDASVVNIFHSLNKCRLTFSATSLGGATVQDEGFAHGEALPDDFKLWLARHPGMTLDEARTRYKEEQKAKQRRTGPKLH